MIIEKEKIAPMFDEIRSAAPVYQPSRFWEYFIEVNVTQLNECSLENFKRTVNQNYYNWLPLDFDNNQLKNVINFWSKNPNLVPTQVRSDEVTLLDGFFDSNPLIDPEKRDTYALFVALLWDYVTRTDRFGVMNDLRESPIGNPIPISLAGQPISQDIANSARELSTVIESLNGESTAVLDDKIIAELGAGYGRLAEVAMAKTNAKYWIFDIPPALYLSEWYIPKVFPNKKIFRFRHIDNFDSITNELLAADIAFFTANQLELIPDNFIDVFISISTLAEMRRDQVDNYKELIARKTKERVYFKQWKNHYNELDAKLTLHTEDYLLPSPWKLSDRRVDPIQDDFEELLFSL